RDRRGLRPSRAAKPQASGHTQLGDTTQRESEIAVHGIPRKGVRRARDKDPWLMIRKRTVGGKQFRQKEPNPAPTALGKARAERFFTKTGGPAHFPGKLFSRHQTDSICPSCVDSVGPKGEKLGYTGLPAGS